MTTPTSGEPPELQIFRATNLDDVLGANMPLECPVGVWLQIYLELPDLMRSQVLDPSSAEAWGYFTAGLEAKLIRRGVVQPAEANALFMGTKAVLSVDDRGPTPAPPESPIAPLPPAAPPG